MSRLLRQFQINANPEVAALVLVLENADASPSELWNKIMTGNRIPFSPQQPNRSSTIPATEGGH
jgi:hypothetical protein